MHPCRGNNVHPVRRGKRKKYGGRRRKCTWCGKTWSIPKSKGKVLRQAAEDWILDRSTLRRIEEKKGKSHMMVWYRAQEYAEHIPHPLDRVSRVLDKASRMLLLDGTFVRVKGKPYCIHIAYDTNIGIVHFAIDDSENTTAYAVMLNMLAEHGYRPMAVVSDGHWSIKSLVESQNLPHQLCVFHAIKRLGDLLKVRGELQGADKVLYSRCKGILKAKTIEIMAERVNQLRRIAFCFRKRRQKDVLRWFFDILHDATIHFSIENLPRTSNDLECLNGQIKARIKTMRGIKSKHSLFNLLKVLFSFRHYK